MKKNKLLKQQIKEVNKINNELNATNNTILRQRNEMERRKNDVEDAFKDYQDKIAEFKFHTTNDIRPDHNSPAYILECPTCKSRLITPYDWRKK